MLTAKNGEDNMFAQCAEALDTSTNGKLVPLLAWF